MSRPVYLDLPFATPITICSPVPDLTQNHAPVFKGFFQEYFSVRLRFLHKKLDFTIVEKVTDIVEKVTANSRKSNRIRPQIVEKVI